MLPRAMDLPNSNCRLESLSQDEPNSGVLHSIPAACATFVHCPSQINFHNSVVHCAEMLAILHSHL